ncbi:MAG TPA: hypothetical protein VKO45_03725 [Methanomicrobiales archaeon]|nr:hypothetical protein [Methanomicrobiales archaeon]
MPPRGERLWGDPDNIPAMKEETRWFILAGAGLVALSALLYTVEYLVFRDPNHLLLYFVGDLAFVPLEVLIVTLVIDRLLASRERESRREKMNMLFGAFFTRLGTPLLARFTRADPGIDGLGPHLKVGTGWTPARFREVKNRLETYRCEISPGSVDLEALRSFLAGHEDFLLRLIENPAIFEHEGFTDLLLALDHLYKELKAREDLAILPPTDRQHLSGDILRVYSLLIPEWLSYMEYLKDRYPYLFSLAMRTNPFDPSASVVLKE